MSASPYYTYPLVTTTTGITWNYTYNSSYPVQPAVPARRKTNREWLAEEVDKVCALARK